MIAFVCTWMMCIALSATLISSPSMALATAMDDVLAGVPLGVSVDVLKNKYPKLYSHKLEFGEVLHEACNQDTLDVFAFTEEPWSPGVVTYIWLRRETDSTVCRDSNGALPDYRLDPSTSRGIRRGDAKARVIQEYGTPGEEKSLPSGVLILMYQIPHSRTTSRLEAVVLFFKVRNGVVDAISLRGKVPGAKAPF